MKPEDRKRIQQKRLSYSTVKEREDRQARARRERKAPRPAGDFAEDFAIESFLICRNDAWFLQVLDALL
jgi:hypothetical protein